MKRADLLRSEAGHVEHLDQAGLDGRLQFLEKNQFPRGMQLADFLRERIADALDRLQPSLADERGEFVVSDRLKGAGTGLIGADLERILAF